MNVELVRSVAVSVLVVLSVVAVAVPAGAVSDSSAAATTTTHEISECTVIDTPGSYVLTEDIAASGTCIEIRASDVTLDGQGHTLSVDNNSARNFGIHVNGSEERLSNVTVTDVELEGWVWSQFGSRGRAILFEHVDDGVISDSRVNISDRGIELQNTSETRVVDNEMRWAGDNDGAIYLQENSDRNVIADNNITEPGDRTEYGGITLSNSQNNTVRDNWIFGSGISMSSGAGYTTVTNNTVYPDWLSYGIRAGFSANNRITDNEVLGPGRTGIRLDHAGGGNLVADNYVNGTGATGIGVTRVQNSTVRDNFVQGNDGDSINIDITSNVSVVDNHIGDQTGDLQNPGWGIQLEDASNGTVGNNTVYISGGGGIRLTDTVASNSASSNNTVVNNSVNYLLRPPGYLDDRSNPATWYPSPIVATGIHGIRLENADGNHLEHNTIRNDYRGFALVDGSENNTLVDNRVHELNYSEFDNRSYEGNNYIDYTLAIQNASGNRVTELDIGNSTAANTTVSVTGRNVSISLNRTAVPNPDAVAIDRYVEATNRSGPSTLDLSVHYEYSDVADINQSTFALWRYDGTEWHTIPDSTLDTDNGTVSAELDESTLEASSAYGAFGQNGTWPTPTETPESGTAGDGSSAGTESGTAAPSAESGSDTAAPQTETGTTGGSGPGFGAVAALVALAAAALLAGRR